MGAVVEQNLAKQAAAEAEPTEEMMEKDKAKKQARIK